MTEQFGLRGGREGITEQFGVRGGREGVAEQFSLRRTERDAKQKIGSGSRSTRASSARTAALHNVGETGQPTLSIPLPHSLSLDNVIRICAGLNQIKTFP